MTLSFGRYRVERELGRGGMGVVHLATDTVLDRPAAVKVVSDVLAHDPEFRRRFAHEAGALARLDSPHVIQIFDHGEQDGAPYIATQYVAGGDLGSLLQRRGPLGPARAAAVVAQVAGALADAHALGIVHRDVKAHVAPGATAHAERAPHTSTRAGVTTTRPAPYAASTCSCSEPSS